MLVAVLFINTLGNATGCLPGSAQYADRLQRPIPPPPLLPHRDKVLVATKVAGPSGQMTWIRGGPAKVDAANIAAAIDGSLLRLGTDYIDLYQIHWPDRYVPMFGDVEYRPASAYSGAVPLEEQLAALGDAVRAGKVRHVGLSNETAWGLMRCLHRADTSNNRGSLSSHEGRSGGHGGLSGGDAQQNPEGSASSLLLPRVASLQNAFSLTCRTFEAHLAECCQEEGVSLLAYSPLAMGLLTVRPPLVIPPLPFPLMLRYRSLCCPPMALL